MPRPTKAELTQELAALGEIAPKAWTIAEIEVRINEIHEKEGSVRARGKVRTPLRHMVVEMNKASKKKDHLVAFMENQLRMAVNRNDTIPILQKKALMKCYQTTMADAEDPVGFGQHCSLQYQEVAASHPDYCRWIIQTNQEESDPDYRLTRLAEWLEKTQEKPLVPKKMKEPPSTSSASKNMPKENQQMMTMMAQMAGMLSELKDEVDSLKESRPHKKMVESSKTDGDSDTGSFMHVSP